jgi:hypothetical protein
MTKRPSPKRGRSQTQAKKASPRKSAKRTR